MFLENGVSQIIIHLYYNFYNITRGYKNSKYHQQKINLIYIDDIIDLTNRYLISKGKSKIINIKGVNYNLKKLYLKIENLWKDYQSDIYLILRLV